MPNWKAVGLAILGIIVGAVFLYIVGGQREGFALGYLVVAAIGVLLALPISRVLTGEVPWYSPHAFVLASLALIYCAAPVAVVAARAESFLWKRPLTPDEFLSAAVVSLAGVFFYLLGWRFGPKRTRLPRGLEWYFSDTPEVMANFNWMAMAFWALGIMAWTYMFALGGGVGEALENMGQQRRTNVTAAGGTVYHIAKFAYVGCLLYFSRNGLNIFSIGMIGLFTGILLLHGSRSFVGILFIGALIVYAYRHTHKIPLAVWIPAGAFIVLLLSFWVLMRQTNGNIGEAFHIYTQGSSSIGGILLQFVSPFMFWIHLAEVVHYVPDTIPLQYGRTFGTVFYIIPSFIWPQQYELFESGSQVYMGHLMPQQQANFTLTPSIFSEFYMNFGFLGVVICPFAYGWLVKWFHNIMIGDPRRRYQIAWIVFAALVSVNMVRVTKNGVGTIIFAFYFSLPFIAIYFFNLKYLFNPPAEDPLDIATAHLDGWTDEDEIVDGYEDWADYGYDDADHDHVATSHS